MLDYLKRVWNNKQAIKEGIFNLLFAKNPIRFYAKRRRKICDACHYNSSKAKSSFNLPYKHCTLCGCSLLIKPYSMESECPKKFWLSRKID